MRRRSLRSVVSLAAIVALNACADSISVPPAQMVAVSGRSNIAASWTPIANMLYTHAAAFGGTAGPDGRIYAFAGSYSSTQSEVYDPTTNTWTPIAQPLSMCCSAAVTAGGNVLSTGGYNNVFGQVTTVQQYDPTNNSWNAVGSLTSWKGYFSMVTGPDGKVYTIGGWTNSAISSDVVEALDVTTGTWTTRAPLALGRTYSVAAVAAGKIYAIGGAIIAGIAFNPTASVEAYDPATNTWTAAASLPVPLEFHAATTGPDGKIYVAGGQTGFGWNLDVYVYDPATDSWTTGPAMPDGRYDGRLVTSGTRLYYFGGFAQSLFGNPTNTAFSLEVAPPPPPTPAEQVNELGESIAELLASGGLSAGNASSLQSTLAAVQASIASGNVTSATGQLGAFVNKVKALLKSGRLDSTTATDLTAAAQAAIASLHS